VQRNSDVSVSQVGMDQGSSFNLVSCARCGTPVGRTYLTTSGQLDAARGAVALLASNVTLYKLSDGPQVDVLGTDMGIASHMARLQVAEGEVASLHDTCGFLSQQVAKLQAMMLLLHESSEAGARDGAAHTSKRPRGAATSPVVGGGGSSSAPRAAASSSSGTTPPRHRGGGVATPASPVTTTGSSMPSLASLASPTSLDAPAAGIGGTGGSSAPRSSGQSLLRSLLSSPSGLGALVSPNAAVAPKHASNSGGSGGKRRRRIAPQLVST
jgi:hypothetical protein